VESIRSADRSLSIAGACFAPSIPPSGTEPPLHVRFVHSIDSNTRAKTSGTQRRKQTEDQTFKRG
jgi:hypothetical protein